jgi:small subunit ribosomal protein S1
MNVGDTVVAFVVRPETADGGAILSIDRAVGEQGWVTLEKDLESAETVEGTIVGFNRGGAIVEVANIQGFVPLSQLVSVSRDRFRTNQENTTRDATETAEAKPETEEGASPPTDQSEDVPVESSPPPPEAEPEPEPEPVVDDEIGKVLKLKVLEVNRARNRAIFSERQAVQEWRDEQKARLVEELTEGETRRGKVTGISSFGAFVDLGGADGLIHISELSWNPVETPEDVVHVGDEIDVFVLRVDIENKKIALSLRRLQPEPWDTINERYAVNDTVDAVVTKLTNFGAFARVESNEGSVEGLIHISELTDRMIAHPREVVREGDEVKLKILRIEPERRRLGLSLKQAEAELE